MSVLSEAGPRICRFGSSMIAHTERRAGIARPAIVRVEPKESRVFRRFAPMIGFVAALGSGLCASLAPVPAQAQVNIEQGKSAAEMFNGDCATCHKGAKGLANGRNSAALAGFLREHYTSSAQQ